MTRKDSDAPVSKRSQGERAPQQHNENLIRLFLTLTPQERAKRFMSVAECAQRIGKSGRSIRQWFYNNNIAGAYIGKTIYICIQSLEEYLRKEDNRRKGGLEEI